MRKPFLGLAVSAVLLVSGSLHASNLEYVGEFRTYKPAFLKLVPSQNNGSKELVISSFGLMGGDRVSKVEMSPDALQTIQAAKVESLTTSLVWPNEAVAVPESVFGPHFVAVAGGFLVPGRMTGGIAVVNLYDGQKYVLSTPKREYFYHRIVWRDMNGDGRLDALTARAKKPMFGKSDGELVWFENPKTLEGKPWVEHILAKGPDVNFVVAEIGAQKKLAIFASEFFSRRLTVHWQEGNTWVNRVIDDTIGAAFDVDYVDINLDGKEDLVVTNHQGDASAGVFAYELPADFKTGAYTKHTLLTGIKTEKGGFNQASPGSPVVVEQRSGKPVILVSGDGSTKVHLLKPQSQDASDWRYDEEVVLDTESTIGHLAVGDVDGDGTTEIFIPQYDIDRIAVFRMHQD